MKQTKPVKTPRQKEKKSGSGGSVLLFLLLIMLLAGGAFGFFYVKTEKPEILSQIQIKLDRFGLVDPDPNEIKRVSDINKLPISYEEKQILINKTIFMGATPRMVMLALGQPKEGHRARTPQNEEAIILVYHLPKDLRPTMLRFEENKLVEARKGSNIEYQSSLAPNLYTGTNSE